MDIYQKKLLSRSTISFVSFKGEEQCELSDSLKLFQNENYRIEGYKVSLINNTIDSIECCSKSIAQKNGTFVIDVDFNSNNFDIVIKFKNGVAEDCILPIELIKADKEKFDIEENKQNHDALIQSLSLKITSGINCINVMWNNACNSVDKSVVEIYVINDGKYLIDKLEPKLNYIAIGNLAYGKYVANVKQYDVKRNLIIENEVSANIVDFTADIKKQFTEVKGKIAKSGRHTVVI